MDESSRRRRPVTAIIVGVLAAALFAVGWIWQARTYSLPIGGPTVVKAGCPAILPGTSDALDDYADMVTWRGQSYVSKDMAQGRFSMPDDLHLGRQITTVGCSLNDPSSTNGQRIAPGRWPDRTATGLRHGTPLYAVVDLDPSCILAARSDNRVVAYIAVDLDGDWTPLC